MNVIKKCCTFEVEQRLDATGVVSALAHAFTLFLGSHPVSHLRKILRSIADFVGSDDSSDDDSDSSEDDFVTKEVEHLKAELETTISEILDTSDPVCARQL